MSCSPMFELEFHWLHRCLDPLWEIAEGPALSRMFHQVVTCMDQGKHPLCWTNQSRLVDHHLHLEPNQVQQHKLVVLHLVHHRFHHHQYLGQVGLFLCHLHQRILRYRFLQRHLSHRHHHRYQQQDQVLVLVLHHNRLANRLVVHHHQSLQDSAGWRWMSQLHHRYALH